MLYLLRRKLSQDTVKYLDNMEGLIKLLISPFLNPVCKTIYFFILVGILGFILTILFLHFFGVGISFLVSVKI